MAAINCDRCGEALPPQPGRGRRRMRHETCPPPTRQQRERALPKPQSDPVQVPETYVDPAPGRRIRDLEAATRETLESVSRETGPIGIAAIMCARRLDYSSPLDTGSQYAALVKEFRATLDAATAGVEVKASIKDPMDEVARRRAEKAAGQ